LQKACDREVPFLTISLPTTPQNAFLTNTRVEHSRVQMANKLFAPQCNASRKQRSQTHQEHDYFVDVVAVDDDDDEICEQYAAIPSRI